MSALYEHQKQGAQWLTAHPHAYLGDKPGIGKTRTALASLGPDDEPLIVCPAIVQTHWDRECRVMGVLPTSIRSYDNIVRGGVKQMVDILTRERPTALILDEAHYLKHMTAQRTKLLLGLNGYARRFGRVICLSGTPIAKHPGEIWPMLASLWPATANRFKLRSYDEFKTRYCVVEEKWVFGKRREHIRPELRNADEFRALLDEFMLQRSLDDVGLDVPAIDWQMLRLDAERDADVLRSLEHDLKEDMEEALDRGAPLSVFINAPHVAALRRHIGELKAPLVLQLLTSQLQESDEKLVVFAHHRSVLDVLKRGLHEFGVAYIDGDVGMVERAAEIDRFQNDPTTRVFVGQTIACQTGITLTAARRAVLVEPDWTAVVNHQAGHRIARIGQQADHCIVQMVCLAGTLDEAIVATNRGETQLVGRIEGKAA